MRATKHLLRGMVAFAALTLVLTACGSSDGNSSAGSAATGPTSTEAPTSTGAPTPTAAEGTPVAGRRRRDRRPAHVHERLIKRPSPREPRRSLSRTKGSRRTSS